MNISIDIDILYMYVWGHHVCIYIYIHIYIYMYIHVFIYIWCIDWFENHTHQGYQTVVSQGRLLFGSTHAHTHTYVYIYIYVYTFYLQRNVFNQVYQMLNDIPEYTVPIRGEWSSIHKCPDIAYMIRLMWCQGGLPIVTGGNVLHIARFRRE